MPNIISEATASLTQAAHRVFAEQACDAAFVLRPDGVIEYASRGAARLLTSGAPLKGHNIFAYVAEASADLARHALGSANTGNPCEHELQLLSADGKLVHLRARCFKDAGTAHLWLVGPDSTQQRQHEALLRRLAAQDPLTGLPNRAGLTERLAEHIQACATAQTKFGAIALDLDGFKRVNDALGHLAGDDLLKEVAARIKACLREEDTVSRTGGDEFFILVREACDLAVVQALGNRVVDSIRRPIVVSGQDAYVSASMGVAVYPDHGSSAAELMQHADLAMYRSKRHGKNRVTLFRPEMALDSPSNSVSLEAALHTALREGELSVQYQPIVDTGGVIRGCEALLRWSRQDGTWVPPSDFIPVAESSGLITLIGDYVMRAACLQLKRFDEAGLPGLYMSVNVSPRQLRNSDFERGLARALELSGTSPTRLVLEITESMLMNDQDSTLALLRRITATGVRFALDDFGTGYSCLAYLKTFPFSALKVDRSFVNELVDDSVSRAIGKAIIDLANALKVQTIVEGVETRAQANVLRDLGATLIQGYFYGRPMPPEDLLRQFALPQAA